MNHLEIQNVDTTTVYDYLSKAYKTYCGKVEKFYFPETLHSNDFNAIIENFIDYINNYYSLEIKKNMDAKTFDIYYLYGYGFKDNPKDTFYERFNVYRNSLEVILNEDEKFTKNIEIQVVSLATFINNRINKNTSRIHSHIKSITEIEKEDKSCAIESYKLDFRIEECKNLENELKIQIRCLLDKIQVLTKELDELSKTLIPKLRFENVDYKKELSVDEEKINRLRRKINKNKLFKKIVNTITSTLGNQTIDPIEEIKVDINILESSIKKYKAKINMKESEIRLANEKVSDLSKEIETLQSLKVETEFNFQDNNGQLSILEREKFELSQRRYEIKSHKKLLEEEIINFEIKMEKDKDIIQDIKFYSSKIRDKDFLDDESTIYIDKLNKLFSGTRYRIEGKAISKHHYDHIKNKIESINKIDSMDRLVKNFLEINYNYLIDEIQTLVRLELIGAVFYIGSIEDKEMILVDEAQDYSLIDYDIIKKINKNNDTYINFFGDYQQNINTNYQFNWNGLEKHFSLKIFNLNENYRNSVEITDYYNAKLGKKDLSIGLSDGDVIEASSLNKALKQVVNCKNYRKIIIVKSIESIITREVLALLQDKVKMITDSKVIDFKKINLLSITDVKGMEFDTVLVINDNLTSNEKYIAYTRALHKLIVIDSKN